MVRSKVLQFASFVLWTKWISNTALNAVAVLTETMHVDTETSYMNSLAKCTKLSQSSTNVSLLFNKNVAASWVKEGDPALRSFQ